MLLYSVTCVLPFVPGPDVLYPSFTNWDTASAFVFCLSLLPFSFAFRICSFLLASLAMVYFWISSLSLFYTYPRGASRFILLLFAGEWIGLVCVDIEFCFGIQLGRVHFSNYVILLVLLLVLTFVSILIYWIRSVFSFFHIYLYVT